jgi:hypothetical protein
MVSSEMTRLNAWKQQAEVIYMASPPHASAVYTKKKAQAVWTSMVCKNDGKRMQSCQSMDVIRGKGSHVLLLMACTAGG